MIVARKALSQSLASFVPSIVQGAAQIATRLEMFRTETLAGFEPVDKKKEAADAEMNELLNETLGLQNIVLPHLDIARSRAGLYIYLNAAVSSHRPGLLLQRLCLPDGLSSFDSSLPLVAGLWLILCS